MNKQSIMYGIIGLLAGGIIAGFSAAYAVNNNEQGMMRTMGMHTNTTSQGMMNDSDMSMSDMTSSLKGKTGDDFDKAFVSEMIAHHQGAIEMAKLTQKNAKHDEVKTLANNIISAQNSEIDAMKDWQKQWGYPVVNNSSDSSDHDMMNMAH